MKPEEQVKKASGKLLNWCQRNGTTSDWDTVLAWAVENWWMKEINDMAMKPRGGKRNCRKNVQK